MDDVTDWRLWMRDLVALHFRRTRWGMKAERPATLVGESMLGGGGGRTGGGDQVLASETSAEACRGAGQQRGGTRPREAGTLGCKRAAARGRGRADVRWGEPAGLGSGGERRELMSAVEARGPDG